MFGNKTRVSFTDDDIKILIYPTSNESLFFCLRVIASIPAENVNR